MIMIGDGTTSPSDKLNPAVGVNDEMATIGRAASAEMMLTNLPGSIVSLAPAKLHLSARGLLVCCTSGNSRRG